MTGEGVVLRVESLRVGFGREVVVKGAGCRVGRGERLFIIGQSGAGKSLFISGALRLLPGHRRASLDGKSLFRGVDLLSLPETEMREIRRRDIAFIPQNPLSALNPYLKVSTQIKEMIRMRGGGRGTRNDCFMILRSAGIHDPERVAPLYPHQISGGMAQRVIIGMAMTGSPSLMVADEPTSALDSTVQMEILKELHLLNEGSGLPLILITHDLRIPAGMGGRVMVMMEGWMVEEGGWDDLFKDPLHPYTEHLLTLSVPAGRGEIPPALHRDREAMGEGLCPYLPACPERMRTCREEMPPYLSSMARGVRCWLHAR